MDLCKPLALYLNLESHAKTHKMGRKGQGGGWASHSLVWSHRMNAFLHFTVAFYLAGMMKKV